MSLLLPCKLCQLLPFLLQWVSAWHYFLSSSLHQEWFLRLHIFIWDAISNAITDQAFISTNKQMPFDNQWEVYLKLLQSKVNQANTPPWFDWKVHGLCGQQLFCNWLIQFPHNFLEISKTKSRSQCNKNST